MGIVNEIAITFVYGMCAVVIAAGLIVAAIAIGGILLFVPGWLIIEKGYYLVGVVYTVFVWGVAWRLTQ